MQSYKGCLLYTSQYMHRIIQWRAEAPRFGMWSYIPLPMRPQLVPGGSDGGDTTRMPTMQAVRIRKAESYVLWAHAYLRYLTVFIKVLLIHPTFNNHMSLILFLFFVTDGNCLPNPDCDLLFCKYIYPVSYTHLDVYKRQVRNHTLNRTGLSATPTSCW